MHGAVMIPEKRLFHVRKAVKHFLLPRRGGTVLGGAALASPRAECARADAPERSPRYGPPHLRRSRRWEKKALAQRAGSPDGQRNNRASEWPPRKDRSCLVYPSPRRPHGRRRLGTGLRRTARRRLAGRARREGPPDLRRGQGDRRGRLRLRAADGPIYLVMRLYWPKDTPPSILPPGSGTWQPPAVKRAS